MKYIEIKTEYFNRLKLLCTMQEFLLEWIQGILVDKLIKL